METRPPSAVIKMKGEQRISCSSSSCCPCCMSQSPAQSFWSPCQVLSCYSTCSRSDTKLTLCLWLPESQTDPHERAELSKTTVQRYKHDWEQGQQFIRQASFQLQCWFQNRSILLCSQKATCNDNNAWNKECWTRADCQTSTIPNGNLRNNLEPPPGWGGGDCTTSKSALPLQLSRRA